MLITNFELIRHADRKAQFLLRISLTLFAVALIGVPPAVVALKRELERDPLRFILFLVVIALYIVCASLLTLAIVHLIRTVRPRYRAMPEDGMFPKLTFLAIAGMEYDAFRQAFEQLDDAEIIEDLTRQVYLTSVLVRTKYDEIDRAVRWLLGGGMIGVVFALALIVSWAFVAGA